MSADDGRGGSALCVVLGAFAVGVGGHAAGVDDRHVGAGDFVLDRARGTLQAAGGGVAVDADDEPVACGAISVAFACSVLWSK